MTSTGLHKDHLDQHSREGERKAAAGPGRNFGISTPGPFQAPILRHEDRGGGEVIASSTRMPNFSSGVKSLQFGLQSLRDCQAAGHLARLLPALLWLCQGWGSLWLPPGAGLGCQHQGAPHVVSLSRGVAAGIEAPGDDDTPVQPMVAAGDTRPRCRVWDWGHVKEARFDEVTATEPSCDCCRGTTGISHSSPRSPSPSLPRRQNNPIAFWNKNVNLKK